MINRVVPLEQLEDAAMALAEKVARMHPHALLTAKQAVNQTLDAMGQHNAIQAVFTLHSLGHANAWAMTGWPALANLAEMAEGNRAESTEPRSKPAM